MTSVTLQGIHYDHTLPPVGNPVTATTLTLVFQGDLKALAFDHLDSGAIRRVATLPELAAVTLADPGNVTPGPGALYLMDIAIGGQSATALFLLDAGPGGGIQGIFPLAGALTLDYATEDAFTASGYTVAAPTRFGDREAFLLSALSRAVVSDDDHFTAPDAGVVFDAGTGDDVLRGGPGNDTFIVRDGGDTYYGSAGRDIWIGCGCPTTWADYSFATQALDARLFRDEVKGADVGRDFLFDLFRLRAGAGDDVVFGCERDNMLEGGAGNDRMRGYEGDDILSGQEGDDFLRGDAGADLLEGGAGADRLEGGADDDVLEGGEGDDVLIGQTGADILRGDAGADRLRGQGGDDLLEGGAGDDVLRGGRDDDRLLGGAGEDDLDGEAGIDRLEGGDGDDRLTGGGGTDTFVFHDTDGMGRDTITDFRPGTDLLDLVDFGFADFGAVLALAGQEAAGLRLTFDDGAGGEAREILLRGLTLDQFDAGDVLLVA